MNQRKGYIGKSMSINAKKARDKVLLPVSYWTSDMLQANGFKYPVSFLGGYVKGDIYCQRNGIILVVHIRVPSIMKSHL